MKKTNVELKKNCCGYILILLIFSTNLFSAIPKYIFLFIGDGMGSSQRFASQKYYEALCRNSKVANPLAINSFPVHGLTTTFSCDSMVTDSAAAATALACGQKTRNGTLSMDVNRQISLETLAEKAYRVGLKVGVVTSVAIDHATPGAFYTHQPNRYNYYDIAMSMSESEMDYFAGGYPFGATEKYAKDKKNPIEALKDKGYEIVSNRTQFKTLVSDSGKVFIYNELSKEICALEYDIDSKPDHFKLAEFTSKGIELLSNPIGFFMMVEGGRIDYSCHSNDAATTVKEIKAFDDAVRVALEFYKKHTDETLIVVTGDHETGGMIFSHAFESPTQSKLMLSNQKCSIAKFINKFSKIKKNKPTFEQVQLFLKDEFGLTNLTNSELERLQKAYEASLSGGDSPNKILYGEYEPFSISAVHILARRAGIEWTSYSHTGVPVLTTAIGAQSELFKGFYDNTDLSNRIAKLIMQNKCCSN